MKSTLIFVLFFFFFGYPSSPIFAGSSLTKVKTSLHWRLGKITGLNKLARRAKLEEVDPRFETDELFDVIKRHYKEFKKNNNFIIEPRLDKKGNDLNERDRQIINKFIDGIKTMLKEESEKAPFSLQYKKLSTAQKMALIKDQLLSFLSAPKNPNLWDDRNTATLQYDFVQYFKKEIALPTKGLNGASIYKLYSPSELKEYTPPQPIINENCSQIKKGPLTILSRGLKKATRTFIKNKVPFFKVYKKYYYEDIYYSKPRLECPHLPTLHSIFNTPSSVAILDPVKIQIVKNNIVAIKKELELLDTLVV